MNNGGIDIPEEDKAKREAFCDPRRVWRRSGEGLSAVERTKTQTEVPDGRRTVNEGDGSGGKRAWTGRRVV